MALDETAGIEDAELDIVLDATGSPELGAELAHCCLLAGFMWSR